MKNFALKHIKMKNMFNLRDIGGYETKDNKFISWNKLYRGDSPAKLDNEDWNKLYNLGIRMVVDLRSNSEREEMPVNPIDGIDYISCPLQREDLKLDADLKKINNAFLRSLVEGYVSIVENETDLLVKALMAVKEGLKKGAVLFHCSAGKDRTGVLSAVILYLCRASDEDIISDYQVTNTYNENGINKLMKNNEIYDKIKAFLNSNPENMITLLEHFKKIDLVQKLNSNGFLEEDIKCIKELLLCEGNI